MIPSMSACFGDGKSTTTKRPAPRNSAVFTKDASRSKTRRLEMTRSSEVSRKAILDATYELLKTVGFHQMSSPPATPRIRNG